VTLDGARGVVDRFEPAVRGPEAPPFEIPGGLFGTGVLVAVLEHQPYLVGPRDLQGSHPQRIQTGTLALRQVLGVAQPDVSFGDRQLDIERDEFAQFAASDEAGAAIS